jgi:hypothetical protein
MSNQMVASHHPVTVPSVPAEMADEKKFPNESNPAPGKKRGKIKLEVYGEEIVEGGSRTVSMTD